MKTVHVTADKSTKDKFSLPADLESVDKAREVFKEINSTPGYMATLSEESGELQVSQLLNE